MQVQTTDYNQPAERCSDPLLKSAASTRQADGPSHVSETEELELQSTDPELISISQQLRSTSEKQISTGGELMLVIEKLAPKCEELLHSNANIMPVTVKNISGDRELKSETAELGFGSADFVSVTAELASDNVEQKAKNAELASGNVERKSELASGSAELLPADNSAGKNTNSDHSKHRIYQDRNYARRGRRHQRNRNQKAWRVNSDRYASTTNTNRTLLQQVRQQLTFSMWLYVFRL